MSGVDVSYGGSVGHHRENVVVSPPTADKDLARSHLLPLKQH